MPDPTTPTPKSTRTTVAGVCAILAALAGVGQAMANGTPIDWASVAAAVMAGVGLIMAKDHTTPGGDASASGK